MRVNSPGAFAGVGSLGAAAGAGGRAAGGGTCGCDAFGDATGAGVETGGATKPFTALAASHVGKSWNEGTKDVMATDVPSMSMTSSTFCRAAVSSASMPASSCSCSSGSPASR